LLYSKESVIKDVLKEHPEAEEVFKKYGIKCFG
jgi:hypothetical protein